MVFSKSSIFIRVQGRPTYKGLGGFKPIRAICRLAQPPFKKGHQTHDPIPLHLSLDPSLSLNLCFFLSLSDKKT